MAGAKGYSSYRGRGAKWKIVLAIFLVLVILAAGAVLYLQRSLIYDADGRPQLPLPSWLDNEAGEPDPPNETDPLEGLDVVIQPPEPQAPANTKAVSLPAQALTMADWTAWLEAGQDCNAVAVRLKTANGTVYFPSEHAVSGAVQTAKEPGETGAVLKAITSREALHTIASLACLQDIKAANADVEGRGLKNTGGYIFYDGNNSLWLDPSKPAAREYVCALAAEIAELGFDELLLTDFSYPTVGKINKINYNTEVPLADNLDLLLRDLRAALEPYEILLSLEVPETVITEGFDEVAGLDLSRVVQQVDRIYSAAAPEHAETLSRHVAQAAGPESTTDFVPELTEDAPDWEGSCLILSS